MRRANIHNEEHEWDASDPEGYKGAAIHLTKVLGAQALAVKSFVLPRGKAYAPFITSSRRSG